MRQLKFFFAQHHRTLIGLVFPTCLCFLLFGCFSVSIYMSVNSFFFPILPILSNIYSLGNFSSSPQNIIICCSYSNRRTEHDKQSRTSQTSIQISSSFVLLSEVVRFILICYILCLHVYSGRDIDLSVKNTNECRTENTFLKRGYILSSYQLRIFYLSVPECTTISVT